MTWRTQAKCLGHPTEWWFPSAGRGHSRMTRKAKDICWTCPVRVECLAYALNDGESFGIWGGYTERERRNIRKQRAA